MASRFKANPVFRGHVIRYYGKGGQVKVHRAKLVRVYYDGTKVAEFPFPSDKRSILAREAYVTARVTRMDRARIAADKKALVAKARSRTTRAKLADWKRALARHLEELEHRREQLLDLEQDFKALRSLSRELGEALEEAKARKPKVKRKLKPKAESEYEPEPLPEVKKPLLPPMYFSQYDDRYFSNRPDSESPITRDLAGHSISVTTQDLDFKEPLEIKKQNRDYYLNLLKEKCHVFAKEHFEEIPGRGEYIIRIKTFENHIIQGKRMSGFSSAPGRVRIDSLREMWEAIEILFSSFIENFNRYILNTVTRSILIRGFSIEQVNGIKKPKID